MSKAYDIEVAVVALEHAKVHAVAAGLGGHFASEIDHLIATAKANRDGGKADEE